MMWILSHRKFAAHLAEVEIMKSFLADLPIPVGCPRNLDGPRRSLSLSPFLADRRRPC